MPLLEAVKVVEEGVPGKVELRHGDIPSTSCPLFNISGELNEPVK